MGTAWNVIFAGPCCWAEIRLARRCSANFAHWRASMHILRFTAAAPSSAFVCTLWGCAPWCHLSGFLPRACSQHICVYVCINHCESVCVCNSARACLCVVCMYACVCVYVCAVQFVDQCVMCWHDFEFMNSYLLQGVVRPSPHLVSCASTVTKLCSINLIAILIVSLSEQRYLLSRVWISAEREQSEIKPEDLQFLKNSSCETFARKKFSFQTQSFTSCQKMKRFGRLWAEIKEKICPRCAGAKQKIWKISKTLHGNLSLER